MDNLAHTLVGAAIGRVTGESRVPAPAILGAVAANAPDWTELFTGIRLRRDTPIMAAAHRGITHSLVGAAVQAAVFTVITGLALRSRSRRTNAPVPWGTLILLYTAALASHLCMDWLGSYGLRPFLPWSDQRYYGDWVGIVDPLFWLVPLVLLAWGQTRRWPVALGATILTALILLLVFRYSGVATWLRWSCAAVAAAGVVGWHRHWFGPGARRAAAATALLILSGYTLAQAGTAMVLRHRLGAVARARFGPDATYALVTRPGYPFTWDRVMADSDTVAGPGWSVPRHIRLPAVREALETADGRALGGFYRFLAADVDSSGGRTVVYLHNARRGYAWRGEPITVPPARPR
ncbi:MAG TPA: metal-dependent hydrolase [Gemmatimonadales bacterium]|nr:metal-dependent hydrolase [Gemmatimonadales bacterium]